MITLRKLLWVGAIVPTISLSAAVADETAELAADQILHVQNAAVTIASQKECIPDHPCGQKEMSGRIVFTGKPSPTTQVVAADLSFYAPSNSSRYNRVNTYDKEAKTIIANMDLDQLDAYLQLIDLSKTFDRPIHCQWQEQHSYVDCHMEVPGLPTPKVYSDDNEEN